MVEIIDDLEKRKVGGISVETDNTAKSFPMLDTSALNSCSFVIL
jgi:hypothetical protein